MRHKRNLSVESGKHDESTNIANGKSHKSVERFVSRMNHARVQKEENQKELSK